MQRVIDPDDGSIHYAGPFIIGNATLCGITDWLGSESQGELTNKRATCGGCIAVANFVRGKPETKQKDTTP